MTEPRIYVACLAAYNNGKLHGEWIDANQDADAIHEEIARILAASPEPGAEEWAIHDHEGFEGIVISEYEDIATVAALGTLLAEHDGALAAFYGNDQSVDIGELEERFLEAYRGEWESEKDYAYQLADDIGLFGPEVRETALETYFDWDAWTRDLFMGDYWSARTATYGVYVFDSNV